MHDFITMLIRLSVVILLSGVIGFEREIKNQHAGLRTHLLVGIGSCSMMLFSVFGLPDTIINDQYVIDPARIPAYVISGIGFLGAGSIIVQGVNVKGLTTAASLWVVCAIGLIVGVGMYELGATVTFITFVSLWLLKKFERK